MANTNTHEQLDSGRDGAQEHRPEPDEPERHGRIRIDAGIRALIPPLTDQELAGLERSLLSEGCRDALKAWNSGHGLILLDGHNRLVITVPIDLYEDVESSETEAEITTHQVDPLPSEALRLVLTEGEFVAAEGFEIDEARRSARPTDFDEEQLEEIVRSGVLVYSLTWTAVPGDG